MGKKCVCWLNWKGFNRGSLHRNHVGVFEFEENCRKRVRRCDGQNNEQNTKR